MKIGIYLILIFLVGLLVGQIVNIPYLRVKQEEQQVGRYQLVLGEIESEEIFAESGTTLQDREWNCDTTHYKTLFRIDTMTGNIDYYGGSILIIDPDSVRSEYRWRNLTSNWTISNK